MPGTRPGHKLVGVWLPDSFHRAIGLLAAVNGETTSDLIRRVLMREAIDRRDEVHEATDEQRAEAPQS